MTTAGRQPYWTFGVFVYAVLLLLIAVPFLMTYRAGTVIADVDRFADPAAKAASRIQAEFQRNRISEGHDTCRNGGARYSAGADSGTGTHDGGRGTSVVGSRGNSCILA